MKTVDDHIPVSVVIPCFRCTSTIKRAMESVLRQTHPPAEIILVDDASSDGTLSILCEYKDSYPTQVKVISLIENSGAASARNAGWAIATQPHVAFLDSDDSWHTKKLEVQYAYMANNPETALCGHQWIMLSSDTGRSELPAKFAQARVRPHHALFKNPFATSTIMMRRDLPFRFENKMRCSEDWLLWLRIVFAGLCAVRLETPLGCVYKPLYGSAGLSKNLWAMEKGELLCLEILYGERVINWLLYGVSVLFSLLKFFKRGVAVHVLRRLSMQIFRTSAG